jgi:hypothetical protein
MESSPGVVLMRGLLLATCFSGWTSTLANPPDPDMDKGKKALFVVNTSKAEFNTKSRLPPTPAQLAAAQTRRSDDERHMEFIRSLGFEVTESDDQSSVERAKGMDLIVISESIRGQATMDR